MAGNGISEHKKIWEQVVTMKYGELKQLAYKEAIDFLLPRHYSGRKPTISKAFGWVIGGQLKAVCSFGKPASNNLCRGILGDEHSVNVYELNRLCRDEDLKFPISIFISKCLRVLKKENWVIVSYADVGMNHCGYVYQACNFIYTGATKERTEKYVEGNKHSRHYEMGAVETKRKIRTSKHRYVYFCTNNKQLKKTWLSCLQYPELPYPKDLNENYVLGEYSKPGIIYLRAPFPD